MWSLYQPSGLWVVWHVPQFLHAKEYTHFVNDAAHKVSTPITKEPDWGPKDWDVTLIQELGDCFSYHICHNVLHEMVLEHQDVGNSRQLVKLHGHLYAGKIYV